MRLRPTSGEGTRHTEVEDRTNGRLSPLGRAIHHTHFIQENEDSQESKVTCLRFYSEEVA